MIKFNNPNQEIPYAIFRKIYDKAINQNQKNIEAMVISSYNHQKKEVDSRFVNLKLIDNYDFIFFTNYNSPKAIAFDSHEQISALFFWPSINTQIRMKAKIAKTPVEYNTSYFKQRSLNKNALAISSNQSKQISNFDEVIKKYNIVKNRKDLTECPSYWGGYAITPYEIEFWEGGENRLNKRNLYIRSQDDWKHTILEP